MRALFFASARFSLFCGRISLCCARSLSLCTGNLCFRASIFRFCAVFVILGGYPWVVRESALVGSTHLLSVLNTRFTCPPSPSPKKKGSIPLPLSLSIHFYDSICLARKPAAVSTAFCSTSPSESSLAKMITAPIGSPFAMIGPIV